MNKKGFAVIVILMGFSILGIIAVQLVWMDNAVNVKNELFDRSVNEAMNNTVKKLEDMHNFMVVNKMAFRDSLRWTNEMNEDFHFENDLPPIPPRFFRSDSLHKVPSARIIRHIKPGNNRQIEIRIDALGKKPGTYRYEMTSNSKGNSAIRVINNGDSPGKAVFIMNSDTMATNIDSLYNISVVKIDSMLSSLDTFNIFTPEISKRAQIKAGTLKRMANKVVTEITEWDVGNIDTAQIQKMLNHELHNRDIPIGFEFGILHDSILICKSTLAKDSVEICASEYRVSMYPNDIFQKNMKLALWFPNRDRFIYKSLNWLLVASFLFSMIILVTFGMSVFYILRQKKISEMKSDFINNMTHEFKTPLATISVATDSIVNEKVVKDPEKIRYFAGMIKNENTRMNRQVEDILTIARLDKKEFEFKWEPVNVHELITDTVNAIVIQVEKRDGKIEMELNAQNPVITTDRVHGSNMIFNLLDNAIKYSVESPLIKISTSNRPKGILISVEDKGIGMTKTVQSKIFERFYRQTSGNIHNVKGFGLGLSYVKAIIEANFGNISVQSEPGNGSRFDVFLPFVRE